MKMDRIREASAKRLHLYFILSMIVRSLVKLGSMVSSRFRVIFWNIPRSEESSILNTNADKCII